MKLTLEYWQDGAWFVGRLVEVPNVFSQGKTLNELKENIKDAYELMLETEREVEVAYERKRTEIEL